MSLGSSAVVHERAFHDMPKGSIIVSHQELDFKYQVFHYYHGEISGLSLLGLRFFSFSCLCSFFPLPNHDIGQLFC